MPQEHRQDTGDAMPLPTADAIRAMDGPALTRLAYALHLDEDPALPGWRWYLPRTTATHEAVLCFVDTQGEHWAPHRKLAQAEAVFRQLRARGWEIVQRSERAMEPGASSECGRCEATHLESYVKVTSWWSSAAPQSAEMDATEALALLRCAVLAVAWEQQQEEAL